MLSYCINFNVTVFVTHDLSFRTDEQFISRTESEWRGWDKAVPALDPCLKPPLQRTVLTFERLEDELISESFLLLGAEFDVRQSRGSRVNVCLT